METLGKGRAFFFSMFALQPPFNSLSCQKATSSTNKIRGLWLHQIGQLIRAGCPGDADSAWLPQCWEAAGGSQGDAPFTVGWKRLFPPLTKGVVEQPLGGWCLEDLHGVTVVLGTLSAVPVAGRAAGGGQQDLQPYL